MFQYLCSTYFSTWVGGETLPQHLHSSSMGSYPRGKHNNWIYRHSLDDEISKHESFIREARELLCKIGAHYRLQKNLEQRHTTVHSCSKHW